MITKSVRRETRWELMEQRIEFVEKRTDDRLKTIDEKLDCIKEERAQDRAHIQQEVQRLRDEISEDLKSTHDKLDDLEKIIYKAVGGMGAALALIQLAIHFWK